MTNVDHEKGSTVTWDQFWKNQECSGFVDENLFGSLCTALLFGRHIRHSFSSFICCHVIAQQSGFEAEVFDSCSMRGRTVD